MKPNPTRSALLVIDMENGFVHPEGGHWIRFAQSMVPNCVRAVELARAKGIPVFFVKRLYRADGSDVELTRYPGWVAGGRACRPYRNDLYNGCRCSKPALLASFGR